MNSSTFENLPKEVLCKHICSNLNVSDLGSLSQVNKYMNKLSSSFIGWRLPDDWQRICGTNVFKDQRLSNQLEELTMELYDWTPIDWLQDLPKLRKFTCICKLEDRNTEELMSFIQKMKQLEELTISSVELTTSEILPVLQSIPNLSKCSFIMISNMGYDKMIDILQLIESKKKLEYLSMYITEPYLPMILSIATFLTSLHIKLPRSSTTKQLMFTLESNKLEHFILDTFHTTIQLNTPSLKELNVASFGIEIQFLSELPNLESFSGFANLFLYPTIMLQYNRLRVIKLFKFTDTIASQLNGFNDFHSLTDLTLNGQIKSTFIIDCSTLININLILLNDTLSKVIIKSCHPISIIADHTIFNVDHTDKLETLEFQKLFEDTVLIQNLIGKSFPNIVKVKIEILSDKGCIFLSHITQFLSLKDLHVICIRNVELMTILSRFTQLESLCISNYRSDVHIKLPNLKNLKIDCVKLSNAVIDTPSLLTLDLIIAVEANLNLKLSIPSLIWLNLQFRYTTSITFEGTFPKLHTLSVYPMLSEYLNNTNIIITTGPDLIRIPNNINIQHNRIL